MAHPSILCRQSRDLAYVEVSQFYHMHAQTILCNHVWQLQAELDKLQPKPLRTIRDRERIGMIEERLALIGKEASKVKMTLKSLQAEA